MRELYIANNCIDDLQGMIEILQKNFPALRLLDMAGNPCTMAVQKESEVAGTRYSSSLSSVPCSAVHNPVKAAVQSHNVFVPRTRQRAFDEACIPSLRYRLEVVHTLGKRLKVLDGAAV